MTDHNVSDSHLLFSLYEEGPEAFEQLPSGALTVFPDRAFRIKWNSRFAAIWKLPLLPADSGDTISFDELESHCREQTTEASRFQLIPSHFEPSGSDEVFRESIVLMDGRIIHRTIGSATSSDRTTLHCVYEEYSADQADLLRLQEWNDTFDALPDHISLLDLSGAIVRANRTMRRRFEPIHGPLEGLDYRLLYCGTATPDPQPPCAQVLAGGPAVDIEAEPPTMDGMYRVAATPVHDSQGRQWGVVSIVSDMTEEYHLRLQSAEQQQQLHELVQSSLDAIIFCDEYGVVSLWNREAENILGWTAEEAIGQRLEQLIVPTTAIDQHLKGMARFRQVKAGPLIGKRTEIPAQHKDGHLVDVEISISAVQVNDKTFVCGSVHDITDRVQAQKELVHHRDHLQELVDKKTEALQETVRQLQTEIRSRHAVETALRSSEQRLKSLVGTLPECILLVSDQRRVLFANQPPPGSLQTEITDCDCQELWPPDAARQLTESLNAADDQPTQHNITVSTDSDGPDLSVELTVIPTTHDHNSQEFVLVFRDITAEQQRKREQERAGTAQAHLLRLSALGEMASNISHEINQPLTSVTNLASAARRGLRRLADVPPAIAEILDEISEEAQRAGSIVHRLRDFARRRPVERTTLKLKECVESAVTLTSNELGVYQTGVTVAVPDDICIYADAIHIQQILVNLILNAVQAMDAADSSRRHIWIDSSVRDFIVTLTVRDTGPGFGDSMVNNPLEAYVTTKPQGTGLGLSICLSLVERNEGTLTIGDSPVGGALITLTLPATRCSDQPGQKP